MKTAILALALLANTYVHAFQVESDSSAEKYENVGGVPMVTIGDSLFFVTTAPTVANNFKSALTKDDMPEVTKNLSLGEPVSKDEALKVLEVYYKHNAFDFNSIKLRSIVVGKPHYVAWCTNPSLFGCLYWEGRAGTWVEYEVNGANRNGGMTGFARTINLIRKVKTAPAPASVAVPPGSEEKPVGNDEKPLAKE